MCPSTAIAAATHHRIQWQDAKKAVRELLVAALTTPVVKVSSMTGRPSNGNKYRHTGGVRPTPDQDKLKDVIGKCTYLSSLDIVCNTCAQKRFVCTRPRMLVIHLPDKLPVSPHRFVLRYVTAISIIPRQTTLPETPCAHWRKKYVAFAPQCNRVV